jgi:hypothetical protein
MFTVTVADNYHYMDESEWYEFGKFATWAEAVAAARRIVDECLAEYHIDGAKPESMFTSYKSFGDDPFISPVPAGEHFSAWDYAEQRCQELCASGGTS